MTRLKHGSGALRNRPVVQDGPRSPGPAVASSAACRAPDRKPFRCDRRCCERLAGATPSHIRGRAGTAPSGVQPTTQGVSTPMRKLSVIAVPLAAALAAGAVAVSSGSGSSHREAPLSALDPTADDTDVYAFTAPDAPGDLTIVSNWIPFEDPAGGPNFYRFDDRARYYLNVDNTGDGVYDIRYRFQFKTTVRNPESFLYALPRLSSIADPKLNVVQTYSVWRETYKNGKETGARRIAAGLPVAPDNVGPKTIPDYGAVAGQAVRALPSGGKVFAGQVDDPFFVDLGSAFDALNLRVGTGNAGGGKDDLAGYNVHSIVLQVPEARVTRDGKAVASASAGNAVIGVWSSTERERLDVGAARRAKARAQAREV